jgi:hypothetical protein
MHAPIHYRDRHFEPAQLQLLMQFERNPDAPGQSTLASRPVDNPIEQP